MGDRLTLETADVEWLPWRDGDDATLIATLIAFVGLYRVFLGHDGECWRWRLDLIGECGSPDALVDGANGLVSGSLGKAQARAIEFARLLSGLVEGVDVRAHRERLPASDEDSDEEDDWTGNLMKMPGAGWGLDQDPDHGHRSVHYDQGKWRGPWRQRVMAAIADAWEHATRFERGPTEGATAWREIYANGWEACREVVLGALDGACWDGATETVTRNVEARWSPAEWSPDAGERPPTGGASPEPLSSDAARAVLLSTSADDLSFGNDYTHDPPTMSAGKRPEPIVPVPEPSGAPASDVDRWTETVWLVAEAFGADRDNACCQKVVRHMDRRELGTRCGHSGHWDKPGWTEAENRTHHNAKRRRAALDTAKGDGNTSMRERVESALSDIEVELATKHAKHNGVHYTDALGLCLKWVRAALDPQAV